MTDKIIIDGIDMSGLSCSECPENEKKRCLEQQEKYKSEIYYLLSFLENDFTKGQIEVLKTKISYPKRCDVVLEKQLKRLEQENSLLSYNLHLKEQENKELKEFKKEVLKPVFLPNIEEEATNTYRSALEEIREELKEDVTCESRECGCDDYGECLNCIKETILTKINEVMGDE